MKLFKKVGDLKKDHKKTKWLCFASLIFIYIALLKILTLDGIRNLDYLISSYIPSFWPNYLELNKFVIMFTQIGGIYVMSVLILILVLYLSTKKQYNYAKFVILVMASSALVGEILKLLVGRDRPLNQLISVGGNSFPSMHSIAAASFFLLMIFIFKDGIKNYFSRIIFVFACILLILGIGLSRIYLNVHWLSDVLAGFLTGLFVFSFLKMFFWIVKKKF